MEIGEITPVSAPTGKQVPVDAVVRRHLRFGWWALFVYLALGLVLEALHGMKVTAYLGVANETRRLMWTLAHAHGTLLALLNLAFAFTVRSLPTLSGDAWALASVCLRSAAVLLPAGFFLGGVYFYSGDPGLGIVLVPLGGLLLLAAVLLIARRCGSPGPGRGDSAAGGA